MIFTNKYGYIQATGQAVELKGLIDDLSWTYAGYIASSAEDNARTPRFDDGDLEHPPSMGNVRSHRKGKAAELVFVEMLNNHGIREHIDLCLQPSPPPESVDFYVYIGDKWQSIDVKSGTLRRGEAYEDRIGDMETFGLPVNIRQCGPELCDLVFYVLFDYELTRGALIGYATRDEINAAPAREGGPYKSPCKIVPISELHSLDDLISPKAETQEKQTVKV